MRKARISLNNIIGLNIFPHDYCLERSDVTSMGDDEFCAGIPDQDENGLTDTGAGQCSNT